MNDLHSSLQYNAAFLVGVNGLWQHEQFLSGNGIINILTLEYFNPHLFQN
ncbi:hypothetical protein PH4_000017 [Escherichia phage PH4]|nr:hypothetical protein PC3_000017 [Escherichia phage PC3]URX65995.1 hypothetical protein PH4_000017 [Escherichia phage PH4]